VRDEQANTAGVDRAIAKMPEGLMNASREKTWDECGIEQKVERVRSQLLMYRDLLQYASRTAGEAKELAGRHEHNAVGEVLQPVQRHGGGQAEVGGRGFDPLR
jgi:hypothetical protein